MVHAVYRGRCACPDGAALGVLMFMLLALLAAVGLWQLGLGSGKFGARVVAIWCFCLCVQLAHVCIYMCVQWAHAFGQQALAPRECTLG